MDRTYKIALIAAVFLHLLLFVALFCHFVKLHNYTVATNVHVIQATAVNAQQLQRQLAQQRARAQRERQRLLAQQRASRKAKLLAAKKAATMRRRRLEKLRLAKEHRLEAARMARIKLARAKRLAAAKVKIEHQQYLAKIHAKEQAKHLAQQNLLAKKRALAMFKQQQQQMLQQQLTAEKQQMLAAAKAAKIANIVDRYKALIVQAISERWIVPANLSAGVTCQLLLNLAPGGVVLNVQVAKSSGNAVLDRSAQTAVWKASPLPVPSDAEAFAQFRSIRLTVHPQ